MKVLCSADEETLRIRCRRLIDRYDLCSLSSLRKSADYCGLSQCANRAVLHPVVHLITRVTRESIVVQFYSLSYK